MMSENYDAGTETQRQNGTVPELNDVETERIPNFTDDPDGNGAQDQRA